MTQTESIDRIAIRRPDDWHVHLRDGAALASVLSYTAQQFARAIVMPNLTPPVISIDQAVAYRQRILALLPEDRTFTPLMTLYLTDGVDTEELERGHQSGVFTAAKLYPAHATTNSAHGVTDIRYITRALQRMEKIGMPLLVHGEVTDANVDIFDREAVFIERILSPIIRDFPDLKIVFEHITTEDAVKFVGDAGDNVAATITPHHLHINRNAMLVGGIRPHNYCLPVAKRERHRLALRAAATSGSAKFFLGTDSAPHAISAKEAACGCAGIFNAPFAIESYASVFDAEGALHHLEAFASENGPRFYGLPLNDDHIELERTEQDVPKTLPFSDGEIVPFHAGEQISWRLKSAT